MEVCEVGCGEFVIIFWIIVDCVGVVFRDFIERVCVFMEDRVVDLFFFIF